MTYTMIQQTPSWKERPTVQIDRAELAKLLEACAPQPRYTYPPPRRV